MYRLSEDWGLTVDSSKAQDSILPPVPVVASSQEVSPSQPEQSGIPICAEVIAQYLKKGNPLLVEGRLKQDTWEKDGQKHSKVKVVLESFTFVGAKKEGDGEQRPPAAAKVDRKAPTESEAPQSTPDDGDDVPF